MVVERAARGKGNLLPGSLFRKQSQNLGVAGNSLGDYCVRRGSDNSSENSSQVQVRGR